MKNAPNGEVVQDRGLDESMLCDGGRWQRDGPSGEGGNRRDGRTARCSLQQTKSLPAKDPNSRASQSGPSVLSLQAARRPPPAARAPVSVACVATISVSESLFASQVLAMAEPREPRLHVHSLGGKWGMASCRFEFTKCLVRKSCITPTLSGTGSKSTSLPRDVGCDAARVAQRPLTSLTVT